MLLIKFEKKEVNVMADITAYSKQDWSPGTPITQQRMDHIEDGIQINRTQILTNIGDIADAKEAIKNQPKTTINVHKATHSKDYVDMYNKIIKKYHNDQISDEDLADLIQQIENMSDEDLDKLV